MHLTSCNIPVIRKEVMQHTCNTEESSMRVQGIEGGGARALVDGDGSEKGALQSHCETGLP